MRWLSIISADAIWKEKVLKRMSKKQKPGYPGQRRKAMTKPLNIRRSKGGKKNMSRFSFEERLFL